MKSRHERPAVHAWRWVIVGAACATGLTARPAAASPCCAGSTTPGFEHLALWELVAGGVRMGAESVWGTWDADGRWAAAEDYVERGLRAEVWAVGRPLQPLQLGARVPWSATWRESAGLHDDGGGVGDVGVSARWDFAPGGEGPFGLGVAAVAGLVVPTGRATEDARGPLAADATGEGAYVPSVGLVLMRPWDAWFVRGQASLGLPISRVVHGHARRRGADLQAAAVAGYAPIVPLTLSVSLGGRWQADSVRDGHTEPDSGRASATWSLAAALDLPEPVDSVALQLAVSGPPPVDHLGWNTPGALGVTAGLRVGWP